MDTYNIIYLWEKFKGCKNEQIASYDRDISVDRFMFMEGIKLSSDQIEGKIIFDHRFSQEKVSAFDSIPNNSASPLVNQKMVDLLLQLAPDDVQFFDAEVRCKEGILMSYKLLNITRTTIGIDHEKSIYTKMSQADAILKFKYCTYLPGCMGSHHLARDKEYLGSLFVTEEVKQVFEKEKIKGIWFATPEEWYGS